MAFGACRFLVIAYLSSIAPFCGRVLFRSLLSESKKDIKDSARLEIMSSAANFPLRTRGHGGAAARQRILVAAAFHRFRGCGRHADLGPRAAREWTRLRAEAWRSLLHRRTTCHQELKIAVSNEQSAAIA